MTFSKCVRLSTSLNLLFAYRLYIGISSRYGAKIHSESVTNPNECRKLWILTIMERMCALYQAFCQKVCGTQSLLQTQLLAMLCIENNNTKWMAQLNAQYQLRYMTVMASVLNSKLVHSHWWQVNSYKHQLG